MSSNYRRMRESMCVAIRERKPVAINIQNVSNAEVYYMNCFVTHNTSLYERKYSMLRQRIKNVKQRGREVKKPHIFTFKNIFHESKLQEGPRISIKVIITIY